MAGPSIPWYRTTLPPDPLDRVEAGVPGLRTAPRAPKPEAQCGHVGPRLPLNPDLEAEMNTDTAVDPDPDTRVSGLEARVLRLESRNEVLLEAVRALVSGLEAAPVLGAVDDPAVRGARLARELLLFHGL